MAVDRSRMIGAGQGTIAPPLAKPGRVDYGEPIRQKEFPFA
jgi:hypothetical protein